MKTPVKKQKNRPYRLPCHGYNPKTGKRVGSRHRWQSGFCIWCNRSLESVTVRE